MNEARVKNKLDKIPDNTEDIKKEWPKYRESFIREKGEEWYRFFLNSVGGRELDFLANRYQKIKDNREEIESRFKRSLSLSFSVIILSLILLPFGNYNLKPGFLILTFMYLEILLTVLFILKIIVDIRTYVLEK